jgi:hypothetical protein
MMMMMMMMMMMSTQNDSIAHVVSIHKSNYLPISVVGTSMVFSPASALGATAIAGPKYFRQINSFIRAKVIS